MTAQSLHRYPAVRLSDRLAAAAAYVDTQREIIDVGTDHALLPCYLYQRGARRLTASDINAGPLLAAKENIQKYTDRPESIRLMQTDGLIGADFAEEIIIAGMGGELIVKILSDFALEEKDVHLILQPMSRCEIAVKYLYSVGYGIADRTVVREGGHEYIIISAYRTGIKKEPSDTFCYTAGATDEGFLRHKADGLFKAAAACGHTDPVRAEKLSAIAEEIMSILSDGENI